MKTRGIVQDQRVTDLKVNISRELRKTMTPAEKVLWELVRNNKLAGFKFRRRQIIEGYIADFFCNSAGLVVELDGPIHDNEEQVVIDELRTEVFKRRGWQNWLIADVKKLLAICNVARYMTFECGF